MKKILSIAFLTIASTVFAVNIFPTYQVTPPGLPSAGAIAGTDQTYLCQGNCNATANLVKSTMTAERAWLNTQTNDSTISTTGKFGNLTVNGRRVDTLTVIDSALTGYATNPTDTLRCSADVYHVDCSQVAGITGSSNGTAFTVGHIPAAFRPGHTVVVGVAAVTNNSVVRYGTASIATTGVITFSRTDTVGVQSATFTGSGTKAIGVGTTFSFPRY